MVKNFFKLLIIILPVSIVIVLLAHYIESVLLQGGMIGLVLLFFYLQLNKKKRSRGRKDEQLIVEHLPFPIVVVRNEKIDYVNKAGLQMFGTSLVQLRKKGIGRYVALTSEVQHKSGIGVVTDEKGKTIDVECYKETLNEELGYFFLVLRDISEQKENQLKLQHVEQLSLLGELATGIAHEIRNPITSLKGFLQLLDSTDTRSKSYTKIMLSEIERINMIVSELLFLGKPKELSIKNHNLFEIIEMVVTLSKTQAIIHNIEIELQMDSSLKKLHVQCDESKLKQVFINILRNAIEAMKREGIIVITVSQHQKFVEISFMDQGKGIPKEKLEKIGRRFYTTKENGTGLGLMISNHIIEEHGGNLRIDSEEGKGTNVQISLPLSI